MRGRVLRRVAMIAALVAATAGPTSAAEERCDFRGWSKDGDPAGLNVRAAPTSDAARIGRLPPPRRDGDESFAVEVHVVGSRDGWLAIDRAEFGDYGGARARTVFAGRGWVSGRMIDVGVQDERVRVRPEAAAEVVDAPRTLPTGDPEILRLDRIVACRGRWIEIEGSFGPSGAGARRATRGWVTEICGNQVTTCQ